MSNNQFNTTMAEQPKPRDEESEVLSPWLKRWNSKKIGFHKTGVNEFLLKYGHLIIPNFSQNEKDELCSSTETVTACNTNAENNIRIFVPLCGKSVDMAFLAKEEYVDRVIGIEGIRNAILEFIQEQPDLNIKEQHQSSDSSISSQLFETFVGNKITLLKGDFFDVLQTTDISVDVIWDRASMVAIIPSLREQYVKLLKHIIKPGGTILLCALDKRTGTKEGIQSGPPFSLTEKDIRHHFNDKDWIESITILEEIDDFATRDNGGKEKFLKAGVTSMYEMIYEIKTKVNN